MAKKSNEQIKIESLGLRGSIPGELQNADAYFTEEAKQLLKFHGIYEQHNRDVRGKAAHNDENFSCMVRLKLPGGQLTAVQYLAMDDIASEYANDTLRITTRQTFQFHGIIKKELREAVHQMNNALVTTLGACGDIVRNVIACPAPTDDPHRIAVQDFSFELSRALYPNTSAYHQIWVDGQELIQDVVVDEPLYGPTYLPRKFKIAIAFPGDNCVDVYTNDVGLVALFDDAGQLAGFNVLAGGGMGMSHNNDATYARLADPVAFVTPEQVVETVTAIVTIHRDYGDRTDRKHARLKYVLQEWGVEKFRQELDSRVSFPLEEARPQPVFGVPDHLGWNEQGGGLLFVGIPVENGRIIDRGAYRLRSGLREIIQRFDLAVRLTPQQNILLVNIQPQDRETIDALLAEYGIRTVEQISQVRRNSMACPAMPTCSLAITEAERILPQVIDQFEDVIQSLELDEEPIVIRMTGCPNGCARPYVAEIAFVGRSLDKYTVYLGGAANGTRLAKPFLDLVPTGELVSRLKPVLQHFQEVRQPHEEFGDFCMRIGLDHLKTLVEQPADITPAGD